MRSVDKNCDVLRMDSDRFEPANVTFVKIAGAIDAHTYEQIEEYLDGTLSGGASRIVLDLGGVTYMSSAGIGVFVGALARTRQSDGDLLLMNIQQTVQEALDVLGLLPMFFVAPDRQMAIKYFERKA